ncbi:FecR family protein [Variovorax sp. PAMC26660]|uniref:FecR family protein n=1 Tax=Variovorax sp. PAMC26660 TaxID=2762322 RepID=UPI00164DD069|nr:FecR domain-containing protein [Variovorax sp. PAMC26660]QNK66578.1 FecR domain-containing protein [Variovorax sp. PAMC26660]
MDMTHNGEPDKADQLRREAQAWLRRLTSGEATQRDIEGFRRWQGSSPLHSSAFVEAKRLWKVLDPAIGQMMANNPALLSSHRQAGRRPLVARRAFLGAAASAAGVAGIAAICPPLGLWAPVSEWNADFRTATGEQRSVALAEGIDLTLNTQTSVQRQTVEGRTVGIDLIAGEAAVDMSSTRQAFNVVAGAGRSEADAGRFEVRYLDGSACVTCIEGRVRVAHATGARVLEAGQQLIYNADSLGKVAAIQPADVSAWRTGVLVFRQTPLARVVEEINRYRPGRVLLLAKRLKDREVSGRFAVAALDTVLVQIQRSYDLDARALPGGVLLLS